MTQQQASSTIDLLKRFADVDPAYGPVPIWWWSGAKLERARLRWQMEQLIAGGVNQAVVMCLAPRGPLYGSLADDPPFFSADWWELFLGACEDAHELGFRLWLYDQYGFSGANFQGTLVAAHPEWAGQELGRSGREVAAGDSVTIAVPSGASAIAAYHVAADGTVRDAPLGRDGAASWSGEPGRLYLCYAQARGFDYYDEVACAALLDTVLGEFRRRADKWFGPVISGLFQDELPHMPTWGKEFATTFRSAYGYDLRTRIRALWGDGPEPEAATVRRDYQAHRAALARAAFFEPYGRWAEEAGLICGFDQQTPAREGDPASATDLYGDYLRTHAVYSAPGSDHWGDPKLHSSLAHAAGHPRTWLEAFHSSGWGGTLEETYDWLGPFVRRGANLYDPHAVYYATVGGWWEWAAPSTCWRQPYWPSYKVFSDSVTRLCSITAGGQLVADTVLLFPTTSVQSDLALDRDGVAARRSSDVYHQLNGSTSWFDERPGILDRSGHDYEVFDEAALANGAVEDGIWRVAGGSFRNVVLPAITTIEGRFARQLAAFADQGGHVIAVGEVPHRLAGPDAEAGRALTAAWERGGITVVTEPGAVPDHLVRGPIWVDADVPCLLKRYGDALMLMLTAHDDKTGTRMPVFEGNTINDRISGEFSWRDYWASFAESGYRFTPVGDRRAHVRVHGVAGHSAQRWDPRSGRRVALETREDDGGAVALDVAFSDGPIAVVVLAADLPEPTGTDPHGEPQVIASLDGDWEVEASSTLDNRWGDLGDPADRGMLPIDVWRVEHCVTPDGCAETPPANNWSPAHATFGPYLRVTGPQQSLSPGAGAGSDWRPYELSLSRGIRKDPLHYPNLGPKGTVPEEFLRWDAVRAGEWVAFAASLDLPGGAGRHLVIGADADREVFLGDSAAEVSGAGYWTASPLPDGPGRVDIEVWLRAGDRSDAEAAESGSELRATFAVVTDLDRFSRPEWMRPSDGSVAGTTVTFTASLDLESVPAAATVQIGSEGPCSIVVNGAEISRQGAFEPYAAQRRPQVTPYDLAGALRPGRNEIALRIDDRGAGVAAFVDSFPRSQDGLGLVSDASWTCARDRAGVGVQLRREQWLDPRWACLYARPHPLPRAAWLDPASAGDGAVLDIVPDAWPAQTRMEWLRFLAPVGTTRLRVPTSTPFTARVGEREVRATDDVLTFEEPLAVGTSVYLRFDATNGHRGGGLLDGPVQAAVAAAPAPLADWESLGLRALGGNVSYRQDVDIALDACHGTVVLDLGAVRGSAEVVVNGERAATLVWSPYRADISGRLRPGPNRIEVTVRGTLAGYLDDASPTPAVYNGQTRHGLFGPVRLLHYEDVER
jgi:hypothetical protein